MAFRFWISAGVLVALTATSLAHAGDPRAEAEADLRRGVALRREGRDAEALELFRHSFERAPSARARAQIALAEQALALWLAAERDLRLALAEQDDPWVRQNREALERALHLVEGKLAYVTVEAVAPGLEVLVNGAPSPAAADGRRRVVAGQVMVEARADGYTSATRTLQIAPETTAAVALELRRLPRAATSPTMAIPSDEPARDTGKTQRLVGLVLTGAGVASAGVGVFFGVRAIDAKSERDADCVGGCSSVGVDADRRGRDAALVSTITTLTGIGLVGVGLFTFFRAPRAPRVGTAGSTTFELTASGARLSGTF
jgi:hypothetical protein